MLSESEVLERQQAGIRLAQTSRVATPDFRIAVLSTFNVEPIAPFLWERFGSWAKEIALYRGTPGHVYSELLNPQSGLYRFRPDAVLLLIAPEDLLPPLFDLQFHMDEERQSLIDGRRQELQAGIQALRQIVPGAACFVTGIGPRPDSCMAGHQATVERLRAEIQAVASSTPHIHFLDWDAYAIENGLSHYGDDGLWYREHMRLNLRGLAEISHLFYRQFRATREEARTVAVVDPDNLLWGGVAAQVGIQNISAGHAGMGLAYQDFQRLLLAYRRAGVQLALSSQYDSSGIREVLREHSGVLMKQAHFTTMQFQGGSHAQMLRRIAEELRLNLDRIVFLSESARERERMRNSAPAVQVPELPVDPAGRPRYLRALELFDLRPPEPATAADSGTTPQRPAPDGRMYDQYLDSLRQVVTLSPLVKGNIAWAVEMDGLANAFHLTGRHYDAARLQELLHDSSYELYCVHLKDRFANYGIVGLAILRFRRQAAEIECLLLHPRVQERKVEDTLLFLLGQRARKHDALQLYGTCAPGPENAPLSAFYRSRGFTAITEQRFVMDLLPEIPGQSGNPSAFVRAYA